MLKMSEAFKEIHSLCREDKKVNPEINYRVQFGVYLKMYLLKGAIAMESKTKNEKLIEKIQKLLNQANDAASTEAESQTCFMMVQKLMAKYKIDEKELEKTGGKKEAIVVELKQYKNIRKQSVITLTKIIADNFKCDRILGDRNKIHFIGVKGEVELAVNIYNAAANIMDKKAMIEYKKTRIIETYVSFCQGFCYGLKEKFEEQIANNKELAVMVIKDQVIVDYLREKCTRNRNLKSKSFGQNSEAIELGRKAGKEFTVGAQIGS